MRATSWSAEVVARVGDWTLDVAVESAGGVLALIGPNGSGKTTLLRVLMGAVEPERAEIVVGGAVWHSTRGGERLAMERRGVGYVPQGCGLFPHLSAVDNVAFGLSTRARSKRARRERARAMLDALGCAHVADRRPGRLSGGERQRVALARALVIEPALMLLDEPLAALDAVTRRAVRRALADQLSAAACPAVMVTHDVRDVVALGAEVCAIERGRVIQRGSVEALRRAPASEFVAEFVEVVAVGAC